MNRKQLIEKAINHIDNLIVLIQAEKLEPGEWDKQHPWVTRDSSGRFGSGEGSSSISNTPTVKDDGKIEKTISNAKKEIAKLGDLLKDLPDDLIKSAKERLNTPEINAIHENTAASLESLQEGLGDVYSKAIKAS